MFGVRGRSTTAKAVLGLMALFVGGALSASAIADVNPIGVLTGISSLATNGSSASSDGSSASADTGATSSDTSSSDSADPTAGTPTDTAPSSTDPSSSSASSTALLYLVKFAAGTSAAQQSAALAAAGATDVSSVAPLRLHTVDATADQLAALQADSRVTRVEQDHSRDTAADPDDTDYPQQWALPRIGWDQVYGSVHPGGTATVAVLDTGVDASNPDLANQLVDGTDVLTGGDGTSDPNGHGTSMAGIVAAATNN